MKPSRVLWIVFLSIALGCVGSAFSQSSTGSISGTVTDQNNALVMGATVFGKNTATGFVRSAITNGYIRTRGTGLLQNVDGNPCLPLQTCTRVNPNLGIIGLYTNASTTYDDLQASLTKRLSRNFSAGLHYTWSTLIDDVTDAILFRGLSPGQRVGTAGRNILRSDGLNLVDFGIIIE